MRETRKPHAIFYGNLRMAAAVNGNYFFSQCGSRRSDSSLITTRTGQ